MSASVRMDAVYMPSDGIVAREIEGEIIIVPLVAGVGDLEDALYTLNGTARAIWDRLDGQRTLEDIATDLSAAFEASAEELRADVAGFMEEVLRRGIVVEAAGKA